MVREAPLQAGRQFSVRGLSMYGMLQSLGMLGGKDLENRPLALT